MLSTTDIQNKEFKKVTIGGYNKQEVNSFIEDILESYEVLKQEQVELKDKVTSLTENLAYYRGMESTIQNALILAEKTAQDTKTLAYEKAEQIKQVAETRAENMIDDAKQEVYHMVLKMDELKQCYSNSKAQIKQVLHSQLEMIDKQVITELDRDAATQNKIAEEHTPTENIEMEEVAANEIIEKEPIIEEVAIEEPIEEIEVYEIDEPEKVEDEVDLDDIIKNNSNHANFSVTIEEEKAV
ncbi:hypothetical protein AN639_08895 [Candidatus Epulonipiscium fishelsonii]|uniref:Uncharacterized protein n=1 Tax=Candidatus Epulonipiscium fishelsonii TaxID=77094 RepID=A0ACC8XDN3_9FIRM|nr:hypothetical protein AN639_08895 [Epulopiscium sp. SCG-B05WGA-EpuloA1]ONI40963.1 hypothetical protein AN396_04180 [Epulopiscium sp. SCG-B11WGA-EpuloA1]